MKKTPSHLSLSRRERQIMDVLVGHGRLSAGEIHAKLADPPSYSAVRATLRIMEEKGHVRHEEENLRYVYLPVTPHEEAQRSAISHLLGTFFGGSATRAMAALLDASEQELSGEELDRMAALIERAREEGK